MQSNYDFEVLFSWPAISDKGQLISCFYGCLSTHKNQLHNSNLFWDIGFTGIIESDRWREPWETAQDQEFCQTWNSRWKVKYHNDSIFRLFS